MVIVKKKIRQPINSNFRNNAIISFCFEQVCFGMVFLASFLFFWIFSIML